MHCFHLSGKISGETAEITDEKQLHHLRDVLRLRPGDEVVLFDITGGEYTGELNTLDKRKATLAIKTYRAAPPGKYKITLACALPKKSLMDDIIDKLTQLDVDEIIPMITGRVVVKLEENPQSRLERWRKIARSAAEQSRRNRIPSIPGILEFSRVLAEAQTSDLRLMPNVTGERKPLKEILAGKKSQNITVLIGPEGDFTDEEIKLAVKAGFIPVSLGNLVLRAETAAIAVAAFLRFTLMD